MSRTGPLLLPLAAPALLLASCAEGIATAARAGAVLALLGGALALVRHRRPPGPEGRTLVVEQREALGRESGVALVRTGTERLLVGWGRRGVRILSRRPGEEGRP